jgi:hypothetical protein
MVTFIVMPGTNSCVKSCVNSPEDGPVGSKHLEILRYMNKIEIVTSVGFTFHMKSKRVLIFSKFFSKVFFILRRIQWYIITNVHRFSRKLPVTFVRFYSKFNFLSWFFEIISHVKFNKNPSTGSRFVPYEQTDSQTWRS